MNSKRGAIVALVLLGACGVVTKRATPPGAALQCWTGDARRVVCAVVASER